MVEVITIVAQSIVAICAFLAFHHNFKQYRKIGTRFFLYISTAYLAFFGWSLGYLTLSILLELQNYLLIREITALSNSLSWLFVAFLIASTEYAKKNPNRVLIESLFLIAGLGVVFYFENTYFIVEWADSTMFYVEAFPIAIIRLAFIMLGAIIIIPVFIGIFKMFKKNPTRFNMARKMLLTLMISGISSIATLVVAQSNSENWLLYIISAIMACIFLVTSVWILENHPTLFLAARHDLVELIIVVKNTGLPLYSFSFEKNELPINPEIVSAFVTSAGHALQQAVSSKSHLERFHFGESEAIISEGFFVYGIILSRSSSDLLNSLLKIVINEFESVYWFKISDSINVSDFSGFDPVIQKLFEFDVPNTISTFV